MLESLSFSLLLAIYVLVTTAEGIRVRTAVGGLYQLSENSDLTGLCSHPDVPENGHAVFATTGPNWVPGTIVKYECDAGFLRLGPAQRECQRNGTWSERAPACGKDF